MQGDWHHQLRRAAFTIGGLLDIAGIGEEEAARQLEAAIGRAAGRNASPKKDRDTILSGLRRGREHPLLGGASHG